MQSQGHLCSKKTTLCLNKDLYQVQETWKFFFLTYIHSIQFSILIILFTDNGHTERAFFQKFKTFGLGQTNWAEILGGILAISSQTIGTILAL